nr:PREDICTED: taste receptor type 2 member 9-like [Anolis carolinensis]|eukprot:XP_016847467.1 PREDICTED: taste receptor type 2 member 9-like [Anolis carolinensis]
MLDSASLSLLFLIVVVAATVVGLMGNGFITTAGCCDWIRRKTLSSSHMIMLALSLSRFFFLGMMLSTHCLFLYDTGNPKCMPRIILFFLCFSNAISLWIVTVLVIFYCMKIVNFTQPLLVIMKLRISKMVLQMLLGSWLVSFLVSLPFIWYENCENFCNGSKIIWGSISWTCQTQNLPNRLAFVLYMVGTFLPSIIYLIFSVILIHSLVHHVKRLQWNTEGFPDQRLAVHLRAIKMLVSFLVLYSANLVSLIALSLLPSIWTHVISTTVIVGYHSGHTITLIFIDSQLKQALSKVLHGVMRQCLSKPLSSSHPKTSKRTSSP